MDGEVGNAPCRCAGHAAPSGDLTGARPRVVVLTGGPGAGKTAVLELARRRFCAHVEVLPESASILFGGGFPRRGSHGARKAAQRAIFRVQRELEAVAHADGDRSVVLCDRGTLDGLAYWPEGSESFFAELGTTAEAELARYDVVIHLRTPPPGAYDHVNPLRTESAAQAALIDVRIAEAWARHPRRVVIDSTSDFFDKAAAALAAISAEVPPCCRSAGTLVRATSPAPVS